MSHRIECLRLRSSSRRVSGHLLFLAIERPVFLLSSNMKVLALASYPVQAAATRYRLNQFVGPLADRGIEMSIRSFLDERLFRSLYTRSALFLTATGMIGATVRRF